MIQFPYQKRATSQKTLNFCIECLESAEQMQSELSIANDSADLIDNENILKGKLDPVRLEKIVNPIGMKSSTFRVPTQSYPLLKDKVDLLQGEEWKRKFAFSAKLLNPDAIKEKYTVKNKFIKDGLIRLITDTELDDDTKKKRIENLQNSIINWKYIKEIRANRILEAEYDLQGLKSLFNKGFKALNTTRTEIYAIELVNGRIQTRAVNWKNIKAARLGSSDRIDDADIIIEETYESPGWIIDRYYDKLKPSEITRIDKGLVAQYGNSRDFSYPATAGEVTFSRSDFGKTDITTTNNIQNSLIDTNAVGKSSILDSFGNIRVTRLVWKSLRKIGIIKWIENGKNHERTVDENYTANKDKGEEINWYWKPEYMQITRIGDDIYPSDWGIKAIQFMQKDNITSAGSGYVGNVLDVCITDVMKPFQVLYDIIMARTKHAFIVSRGKVPVLDLARKPKSWDVAKWDYYLNTMNTLYENSFNEGAVGVAKGKISGNMQQSTRVMDLENGAYVQQHLYMLQYIEKKIGDIVGISKAREGQSSSTETATGVQNAVTQSYHITEPYYAIHEAIKDRVLNNILEGVKYCIKVNPELYESYLGDNDFILDEIDSTQFTETSYNVVVTSSGEDYELLNQYKQLAHAAIQNNAMKLSTLATIYSSKSILEVREKLEKAEQDLEQKTAQQNEASEKMKNQMIQLELKDKQDDRESKEHISNEKNKMLLLTKLMEIQRGENGDEISTEEMFHKMEQNYSEFSALIEQREIENKRAEKEQALKEEQLKQHQNASQQQK